MTTNLTNKKKSFLLYSLGLMLGGFILLSAHNAHALVFTATQYLENDALTWGYNQNYTSINQTWQVFKATSPLVSGITLKMRRNTTLVFSQELRIFINDRSGDSSCDITNHCKAYNYVSSSTLNVLPLSGTQVINLPLTQTQNLVVGQTYYITFYDGHYGYGLNQITQGFQNTNSYPDGNLFYNNFYGQTIDTGGDLYFALYYNQTGTQVITPEEGKMYKDFPNFQIDYGWPGTSTMLLSAVYTDTITNISFTDTETVPATEYARWALTKKHALADGVYKIQANLYTASSTLLASSTIVNFIIDKTNGTDNFLGGVIFTSTTTLDVANICRDIDTNTFFGGIDCGLRRLLVWAFFPSSSSVSDLQLASSDLKTHFPFSTFFDLTTIVNATVASTSSSTKASIGIPFIKSRQQGGGYYVLPVITTSTMSNAIGSTNSTLFRNSIGWIMWIFSAGMVVIRLI